MHIFQLIVGILCVALATPCTISLAAAQPIIMVSAVAAADGGATLWNKYLPAPSATQDKAPAQPSTEASLPSPIKPAASAPSLTQAGEAATPVIPPSSSVLGTAFRATEAVGVGNVALYIKDTKKFFAELAPSFLHYMGNTPQILAFRLLISLESTELKFFHRMDANGFMLECVPARAELLQVIASKGCTLKEFTEMFGENAALVAAKLQPSLDSIRTKATSVDGIYKLEGLYLAVDGDVLLLSDKIDMLVEMRSKRSQKSSVFDIPAGYYAWGHMDASVKAENTTKTGSSTSFSNWIGMNPTAWGWKFTHGVELGNFLPKVFTQMPAMGLTATELYGTDSPFFVAALHGKFLAMLDVLQNLNSSKAILEFDAASLPIKDVESITLSFGGVTSDFIGIPLPGVSLTLTGKDASLNKIAEKFRTSAKTNWISTAYPQWTSASVSQGSAFELPLPLLIAQKNNTLVMGIMSASSFSQGRQISVFMEETLKKEKVRFGAKELAIPLDISSLYIIDVQALWRTAAVLLGPGQPLRLFVAGGKNNDSKTLHLMDQMRALTPPVLSMVSWNNAPNALEGEGYILLHRGDSTAFSKTLALLLMNILKNT